VEAPVYPSVMRKAWGVKRDDGRLLRRIGAEDFHERRGAGISELGMPPCFAFPLFPGATGVGSQKGQGNNGTAMQRYGGACVGGPRARCRIEREHRNSESAQQRSTKALNHCCKVTGNQGNGMRQKRHATPWIPRSRPLKAGADYTLNSLGRTRGAA
jgi:hypothetical protein